MDFLRNSRYTTRFAALVLFFLVSFSVYGLYCFNTVTAVKINGTFYQRIMQGKDVIADILPPPAYLIETYLTAFQMLEAEPTALSGLEAKIGRLRAEYLASQEHWRRDLEEGPMKRLLVEESYRPGLRMLEILETEFIPALRAGNREKAKIVLFRDFQPEYAVHRAAIDKVVALALERHRQVEASAAVAVESRTYGQIALGVVLFFTLTVVSAYAVQKSDAGPSPGIRQVAGPLSSGSDQSAQDPEARLKSGRGQFRESA